MTDYKNRANHVLSPVIGRYHPIEISRGEGCYLYDTNQTPYLDLSSGLAVTATGHCHPKVVTAIKKQAETLIHPCVGIGYYDPPITLAEKLNRHLSGADWSSFFCQSGSDANEAAIKLAKYVSKRPNLVAFKGGFHGRSLATLSLTTSKQKYREGYDPLLPGISFFPFPYTYRCPWDKNTTEESTQAAIDALEEDPIFNDTVAAVIIEPMIGEGGYIPAPKAFLKALRKKCDEHGILLIFDEIQTGIGRTGTWCAYEQLGVVPDIITLAKGLGSGMPIGACVAKKEIMDQWPAGAHGGTFGANPITCQAANATLDIIENVLPQINPLSDKVTRLLKESLKDHPHVGDIRSMGFMIGIECVQSKNAKEPYPEMVSALLKRCYEKNLIIISCGVYDNVIRIIPPLIIDEETLITGIETIIQELHDYH